MDATLKRKWVEALLSGKYEQASGELCTQHGYCCLGVLGDVASVPLEGAYLSDSDGDYLFLPQKIQYELADANDEGVPFDMIAGLIDEAL